MFFSLNLAHLWTPPRAKIRRKEEITIRDRTTRRRKRNPRLIRRVILLGVGLILIRMAFIFSPSAEQKIDKDRSATWKPQLAQTLEPFLQAGEFPSQIELEPGKPLEIQYSIDGPSQTYLTKLLNLHRPDYAAFVALEAETGRVIAMVQRSPRVSLGHLALKNTFPAASLFKIVTATAAIDSSKAGPDTVIPFNGSYYTLYRRNVNETKENRWTRRMTMREAFAKSVNPVFAKLGIFFVGPPALRSYASRFHFDEPIVADIPFKPGQFAMPQNDSWAIAEAASGFNDFITLSPLQAALMAATVANDGVMMEPFFVEAVVGPEKTPLYLAARRPASSVMRPESARQMRLLMEGTIRQGTSRSAFRTLLRNPLYKTLDIGGKTGSLTGSDPKGKYDWFIGYATEGEKKIALAALTINEENWRVKSSYLARVFIEQYFKPKTQRGLALTR